MNTIEDTQKETKINTPLCIRAVSGGVRGQENSGKKYAYNIGREDFLSLVGQVFDKEVEESKAETAKSGGAVSQFLHSYGVTAEKMEKSGRDPFPVAGKVWNGDNTDAWLEVMEFKKPREAGSRKTAKEHKMDAILLVLAIPGVTWEAVKVGYSDITKEELEAYKVKLAEKNVEA